MDRFLNGLREAQGHRAWIASYGTDELREAQRHQAWIAPYGTVAAKDTPRDAFGNYFNSADCVPGDGRLHNSQSPLKTREQSHPDEKRVAPSSNSLSVAENPNSYWASAFLERYRQNLSSATASSSQHLPNNSSTILDHQIDPVLFVFDKLASQSNLTGDALNGFLEYHYGPSNTLGNQAFSEQEVEKIVEMLSLKLGDIQPSFIPLNDDSDNSGEMTSEQWQELNPATKNDMIISPFDDNQDAQEGNALVRSVNSMNSLQEEILRWQEEDRALARESLNVGALDALPTTEETDLKDEAGRKELETRLSARRPYPHTTAQNHAFTVSSVGLPYHYTKPSHSERALLQASDSAPFWEKGADRSAVLYEQEPEQFGGQGGLETSDKGKERAGEETQDLGHGLEETQDLGHGLEDAEDIRTLFPSLYDDLVILKANKDAA